MLQVEVGPDHPFLFAGEPNKEECMRPRVARETLVEAGQHRGATPVIYNSGASVHVIEVATYDDDRSGCTWERAQHVRLSQSFDLLFCGLAADILEHLLQFVGTI